MEASKHIHKILLQHLTDKALVLGPSPAALSRINNEYRFQILVKYKSEPALHEALKYLDDYYHDQYLKKTIFKDRHKSTNDDVILFKPEK